MEYRALIDYLEDRLEKDEAFLLDHQDQLDTKDQEQRELYEYTQGRIDMCRQVLRYLQGLHNGGYGKTPHVTNSLWRLIAASA